MLACWALGRGSVAGSGIAAHDGREDHRSVAVSDGSDIWRGVAGRFGGLTIERLVTKVMRLPAALPEFTRKLTIVLDRWFLKPLILLAIFEKNRIGVPYEIRTRVAAVKGRCPGPLDERDRAPLIRAGGG